MIDSLAGYLDVIAAYAPAWGYAFVFAFMAVESSFIPFPSEVVMLPAGFLAARGMLTIGCGAADLVLAVLIGTLGSIAGAYFNYWLSAKLGEPFLRKYGKWFFVKPQVLDRSCELFNKYGAATTFVCRLVPVIRQVISIPAGLAKMPLGKFILFTGLGAGIWSALLAAVGYFIGSGTQDVSNIELLHRGKAMVDAYLWWIIAGAVLLVVCYMALSKLAMGKGK